MNADPVPEPSDPGLLPDWVDPVESVAVAHVMIPVEMPGRIIRVNLTMNEALLTRADAVAILARNHGLIASFSRALTEGLSAKQSDAEFDKTLAATIEGIYKASCAG